jgi:hypothetical protein
MNIGDIQQQQMIEKALVDAGYPVNKINSLVQQINGQLQCGPECQKLQKSERLRELYQQAMINVENAPNKLINAEKNYYVETQGLDYYNDIMTEKYVIDVQSDSDNRIKEHKGKILDLKSTSANYSNSVKYHERMEEFLIKLTEEGDELKKKIEKLKATTLTNDRKTYYEDQQITSVSSWIKIINYLYWIVFIVLCVKLFVVNKNFEKSTFVLLFLLAITPKFLIPLIILVLKFIYEKLIGLINFFKIKDAYADIKNPSEHM